MVASRARGGYTLIELLVVISIVLLLAALLFPVLAKAREKARQASCICNLKQILIAAQQYAQDYDGRIFANYEPNNEGGNDPDIQGNYGWHAIHYYRPYMASDDVARCPSLGPWLISYGQNVYVGWSSMSPCIDLTYSWADPLNPHRHDPSSVVLFAESSDVIFWEFREPHGQMSLYRKLRCHHTAGGDFGYFDGHAKWQRLSALTTEQFGGPTPFRGPDRNQCLRCENE
jgi:prepilin-type N-terminal cleavage/methylation domain-containing protein